MFRTKTARSVVGLLLSVVFSFTCLWFATDDAEAAIKFVLGLFAAGSVWAVVATAVSNWIDQGEG